MAYPDIKDVGALQDVIRYGVPWHGRIEAGTLHTGKLDTLGAEITRAWAQPEGGECWVIQAPQTQTVNGVTSIIPGTVLPDPYATAPAQKTADAEQGMELTNYAILSGAGDIHGKAFLRTNDDKHRWIWIDDEGKVWSVVFGLVAGTPSVASGVDYDGFPPRDWSFADTITARFKIRRFGEIRTDGPPAPEYVYTYVIPANGLQQDTPSGFAASGNMILRDLSPRGHLALMEIHSLVTDTQQNLNMYGTLSGNPPLVSHRECSNALGFVEFALSGTGAAAVISMSVVASRAQALGTIDISVTPVTDHAVYACVGNGQATYDIDRSATGLVSIVDRIFGYHYDTAGTRIPHKMTFTLNASTSYTVPMGASASFTYQGDYSISYTIGAHTWSATRTRKSSCSNDGTTLSGTYESSGMTGGEDEPYSEAFIANDDVRQGTHLGTFSDTYSVCGTAMSMQGSQYGYLLYPGTTNGYYGYLLTSGGQWWPEELTSTLAREGRMKIVPFRLGRAAYNLAHRITFDSLMVSFGDFKSSLGTITEAATQKSHLPVDPSVRRGGFNPISKELFFPLSHSVNFT